MIWCQSLAIESFRHLEYLDLRLEKLNKIINVIDSFILKCNHKKNNFKHNIHSKDLENSYKTINTIVDLIINFLENFNKNFNPDIYRIKRLENKVELIGKNLDYINSLELIKENRTFGYKRLINSKIQILKLSVN